MQRITTPSGVLKESPRSSRKDFSESITSHTVGFLNPTARNTFHSLKTRGACYRERTYRAGNHPDVVGKHSPQTGEGPEPSGTRQGQGRAVSGLCSLACCSWEILITCWGFKVFIYKAEIMMFMISSECNEFTMHKKLLCLHIH